MANRKIVIPSGMLEAACKEMNYSRSFGAEDALRGAIGWLLENPIVPTEKQVMEMVNRYENDPNRFSSLQWYCSEWQKKMFLAPDPEIPEEIKDLLFPNRDNSRLVEAFRRGQACGK